MMNNVFDASTSGGMTRRHIQSLAVFVCFAAFGVHPAQADDNVISTVVNTLNGGHPLNGDDSLTISPTGEINRAATAVQSTSNNNTIIHQGRIVSTGAALSHGISVSGGSNTTLNSSGSVSASGVASRGIIVDNNQNSGITQSGSVTTTGNNSNGIEIGGNSAGISLLQSGTLSTAGSSSNGIALDNADNNTITHTGMLSTAGGSSNAINLSSADNNTLNIGGTISTTGISARGIQLNGGNNNVVNQTGSITTTMDAGMGIDVGGGSSNQVNQSGTIISAGANAIGVNFFAGDDHSLAQSGTISTSGFEAFGVVISAQRRFSGALSGTISTAGDQAHAVLLNNSQDGSISLSGQFSATGASARGLSIIQNSDRNILNVTGHITSGVSNAILIDNFSNNNQLNFTTGAFLSGPIGLGTGGNFVTISTTPGHSVIWDFGATSVITNGIQVSGTGAFAINGNVFYSVDTTDFVGQTNAIGDLGGLLSGLSFGRAGLDSVNGGAGAGLSTSAYGTYALAHAGDDADVSQARLWGDVFGGTRRYGSTNITLGYESHQYGAAFGAERDFGDDRLFGVMGGYLAGELNASSTFVQSQALDSRGGFGGLYGSTLVMNDIKLAYSLIGGGLWNDKVRRFNNNANALETAQSSYNSWFVAPAMGVSKNFDLGNDVVMTPSFSAVYAHQWSESYSETGSSANLTAGSNSSGVFEGRATVAFTYVVDAGNRHLDGHVTVRGGAVMRANNYNIPNLSLAGVGALTSANVDQDTLFAGTAGFDASIKLTDNLSLNASADLMLGNDDFRSIDGKVGFKLTF